MSFVLPSVDDPAADLLLDFEKSRRFALGLTRTVLSIEFEPKRKKYVLNTGVRIDGFAVAVADKKGIGRVITGGPLAMASGTATVRAPSGREVPVTRIHKLGDGGLAELVIDDVFFWAELQLARLADSTVALRPTMPLFSVQGLHVNPGILRGDVSEVHKAPVAGVLTTSIGFPHGLPLFDAHGRLLAVTYRQHPQRTSASLAIDRSLIGAWLSPEDPVSAP